MGLTEQNFINLLREMKKKLKKQIIEEIPLEDIQVQSGKNGEF